MVDKKAWKEFRDAGLLWWINLLLHMFGWAIVLEIQHDEIIGAYPARVKYRGFDEKFNVEGYIKVSEYLQANINELVEESKS